MSACFAPFLNGRGWPGTGRGGGGGEVPKIGSAVLCGSGALFGNGVLRGEIPGEIEFCVELSSFMWKWGFTWKWSQFVEVAMAIHDVLCGRSFFCSLETKMVFRLLFELSWVIQEQQIQLCLQAMLVGGCLREHFHHPTPALDILCSLGATYFVYLT